MNLARAQKLLQKGKFAEAEHALRVRESASYDPRRDFILARIHEAAGEPERAMRDLENAKKQAPSHAPAHLLHGISLYDANQFEPAEAAFRHTLKLQPQNDLAFNYLALCLLALGRDEEGLSILRERSISDNRWFMVRLTEWMELQWLTTGRFFSPRSLALEASPADAGYFSVRKREKRAQKYFYAKNYEQLLQELAPIAAAQDPDEEILFACALSCEMLGYYERALQYLSGITADDILPDAARAARARCTLRLGRFAEAAEDINKVLMIGPEDYGVNYYLGVLCLTYGQRDRARQLFYRAYSDYLVDTLEYQFWQIQQALFSSESPP